MRRHSSVVFGYGSLWLFVCLQVTANINPAQRVEWRRSFEGSSGDGIIASCADVNICTSNDASRYNVSRRVGTTSSLFILNINTTIPMSSAESMLESVSASYEGKVYFSATCKLQRNVTYLEGTYSYWAIISPGSVRHTVQFEGPSTVVAPSVPTLEGCSSGYTPATQDVICTCKVNNLGWPRGHVTWLDQRGGVVRTGQNNSVQLLSRDIPECSENTNITYTCEVRSTDNFRRTIDYTPTLAFGPQYVKVTGPTAFLVDGKQPMTLTCTAVKVNPRPVFTWQGQPDDAQTSAVSQAEDPLSYRESISFVPTMGHDGRIISCFAKNSGFNGTSVPSATFTISLIRPGADNPESAELSSSDTTVFFAAVGIKKRVLANRKIRNHLMFNPGSLKRKQQGENSLPTPATIDPACGSLNTITLHLMTYTPVNQERSINRAIGDPGSLTLENTWIWIPKGVMPSSCLLKSSSSETVQRLLRAKVTYEQGDLAHSDIKSACAKRLAPAHTSSIASWHSGKGKYDVSPKAAHTDRRGVSDSCFNNSRSKGLT
ncbi:hypothetical protein BaRGS_00005895, partial [Batillaria attramentaria]